MHGEDLPHCLGLWDTMKVGEVRQVDRGLLTNRDALMPWGVAAFPMTQAAIEETWAACLSLP